MIVRDGGKWRRCRGENRLLLFFKPSGGCFRRSVAIDEGDMGGSGGGGGGDEDDETADVVVETAPTEEEEAASCLPPFDCPMTTADSLTILVLLGMKVTLDMASSSSWLRRRKKSSSTAAVSLLRMKPSPLPFPVVLLSNRLLRFCRLFMKSSISS